MWKAYFVLVVFVCVCVSVVADPQEEICPAAGHTPGGYSQISVDLCYQDGDKRHLKIDSPDRSVTLVVNDNSGQLYRNGKTIGNSFSTLDDQEWLWSPDSRAAILTTSMGSAGPVIAGVSFVGDVPAVRDVMKPIQTDFAARHTGIPCSDEPNIAGLGWVKGSTEAVLVAEIPSTHCEPADGYFEAYVMSIPEGKILRRYSMNETVKQFRELLGPILVGDVKLQREERASH